MTMEALFGKLLAYEHELIQQYHAEETKKKRKEKKRNYTQSQLFKGRLLRKLQQ